MAAQSWLPEGPRDPAHLGLPAARCDFQPLHSTAGPGAVRVSPLVLPIRLWRQLIGFLTANGGEHLFTCSSAICTSSWVKCLFQTFAYLQVVLSS